jgi:multiple sugar transport system permease protein
VSGAGIATSWGPRRRARIRSFAEQQRRFFWMLLGPVLVVLALITLLPTIYLIVISLTPLNLTRPDTGLDFSRPLANYAGLLTDSRLHNSLWVQAKLSSATVGLQLLLGLGAALALNGSDRLGRVIRTSLLVPMVLPPIVVAVIWKMLFSPDISPAWWLFNQLGWQVPVPITDARFALGAIVFADTWEWFPFTMLIILSALSMMPEELVEAARLDGASSAQLTWHITLPYIRGALLVAGLFRLIDSIKAFPLIYLLTNGGPGTVTEVPNYYIFVQSFTFSFLGYSAAVTVGLVGVVCALSWIIIRVVGRTEYAS